MELLDHVSESILADVVLVFVLVVEVEVPDDHARSLLLKYYIQGVLQLETSVLAKDIGL